MAPMWGQGVKTGCYRERDLRGHSGRVASFRLAGLCFSSSAPASWASDQYGAGGVLGAQCFHVQKAPESHTQIRAFGGLE